MAVGLLPRVRVNYTMKDLLKAFFVREKSHSRRDACRAFLSRFYQGEDVLLVPSARDAIYELLVRLPQKKVVLPSYTCMVVNEAVRLAGKILVYARCDYGSFNASYSDVIDKDTIVLATHQYGLPCRIREIAEKCRSCGAVLIEDCATSLGTMVDGQLTGTFGDYAVISLNQSKTLTVPPMGGLLIGKNAVLLETIRKTAGWTDGGWGFKAKGLLKGCAFVIAKNVYAYRAIHWLTMARKGKLQRTQHEQPSEIPTAYYKFGFTEWQASILWSQLEKMNEIFEKHRQVYAYYDAHIQNPLLVKPVHDRNAVCTRYAVLATDRRSFYEKSLAKGIDLDFSHCSLGCPSGFSEEHRMAVQVMNLPFYSDLSVKELERVVKTVNSVR